MINNALLVVFCQWFSHLGTFQRVFQLICYTQRMRFYTQRSSQCTQYSYVGKNKSTRYTYHSFQQPFPENVCLGIANGFLITPYLLPTQLNGRRCGIFLEEVFTKISARCSNCHPYGFIMKVLQSILEWVSATGCYYLKGN